MWKKSCDLEELQANFKAERLKLDFVLNNVDMNGATNEVLLKDLRNTNVLDTSALVESDANDDGRPTKVEEYSLS